MAEKASFNFGLNHRKPYSHRGCDIFDCQDQNQNSFLGRIKSFQHKVNKWKINQEKFIQIIFAHSFPSQYFFS